MTHHHDDDISQSLKLRKLNDYESMLASMTCNVAMSLEISQQEKVNIQDSLRRAWRRTVSERYMLQVKLLPLLNDIGPLGQRYTLEQMNQKDLDGLFIVKQVKEEESTMSSSHFLVSKLKQIGTTRLNTLKGSFYVECLILEECEKTDNDMISVQVVMSLCHALSDGPGALQVANSFLQHISDVLDHDDVVTTANDPQPLTDLQALILGNEYAANQEPKSVFDGQDDFVASLESTPMMLNDATVLPPEAMQKLPSDKGFGGPTCIDCIHFTLNATETTALRQACRRNGATMQGAITATSIQTRAKLLGLELPVQAAVQVPVNTRSLANVNTNTCLCGSAGVWHLARLSGEEEQDLFALARQSTEAVREGIRASQPQEWLRRLFHVPATLAPYSLMVSSVGVAPVQDSYKHVNVGQLYFFGGALKSESPSRAQSTMIHAVTFRDELTCMLNYTSPGVSKLFVEESATLLKEALSAMALNADLE